MYKTKIFINSTDVDKYEDLSLPALFKFCQEVAAFGADDIGLGKSLTTDVGKNWVLTRVDVSINKLPKYYDEVIVKTYPKDTIKFIFPRHFSFEDKKGNVYFKVSAAFMVIDGKSRQMLIKPFDKAVKGESMKDEIPFPKKVTDEDNELIYSKRIRFSDLDLNGHMNNVRYIESIVDLFNSDHFSSYKIKDFSINYVSEVHEGETLSIYASEDKTFVKGMVGDRTCFLSKICFINK